MSEIGDGITEVRSELAAVAAEIFPDLCDIIGRTFTDGGAAGDTLGTTTLASGVPLSYKSRGGNSQVVVGGKAYTASHDLELPFTAITIAITPEHVIRVSPRGLQGQLIFENPIVADESLEPFVGIHATLVKQGYSQ